MIFSLILTNAFGKKYSKGFLLTRIRFVKNEQKRVTEMRLTEIPANTQKQSISLYVSQSLTCNKRGRDFFFFLLSLFGCLALASSMFSLTPSALIKLTSFLFQCSKFLQMATHSSTLA